MGAKHDIHLRSPFDDLVLLHLGEAPAYRDLHPLVLTLPARKLSKIAVELVCCVLAHRASVDDDDICVFGLCLHIARGQE